MGKIFVGDTSLGEKFSWMEANHENNEIKSTTKIFTYTVSDFINFVDCDECISFSPHRELNGFEQTSGRRLYTNYPDMASLLSICFLQACIYIIAISIMCS